jgi:predicted nuclease with TOPRIM domain
MAEKRLEPVVHSLEEHRCTDYYTQRVLLLDQEFTRLTKDNERMLKEKQECEAIMKKKNDELDVLRRDNSRLKEEQARIRQKGEEELAYHKSFSIEKMEETVNKINENFKGGLNKPPVHLHEKHYKEYADSVLQGLQETLRQAQEARKHFNKTLQETLKTDISLVYKT